MVAYLVVWCVVHVWLALPCCLGRRTFTCGLACIRFWRHSRRGTGGGGGGGANKLLPTLLTKPMMGGGGGGGGGLNHGLVSGSYASGSAAPSASSSLALNGSLAGSTASAGIGSAAVAAIKRRYPKPGDDMSYAGGSSGGAGVVPPLHLSSAAAAAAANGHAHKLSQPQSARLLEVSGERKRGRVRMRGGIRLIGVVCCAVMQRQCVLIDWVG